MKKFIILIFLQACCLSSIAQTDNVARKHSQKQNVSADAAIKNKPSSVHKKSSATDNFMLGTHLFSLQWISWDKTHDVAIKQPNELGIYDMTGNVVEWCNDYWNRYNSSSQTNPTGPYDGISRIFRGGSFCLDEMFCERTNREYADPHHCNYNFGFRLALSDN